jgi:hypothetical protein
MTKLTPIAEMIKEMVRAGAAVDTIVAAVQAREQRFDELALKPQQLSLISQTEKSRGMRLAKTWRPSKRDIGFAQGRGLTNLRIQAEAEKFINYWTAKSGASATKLDWEATWRNWIIKMLERQNDRHCSVRGSRTDSASRRVSPGSDAIVAGMGRLARRIDEGRTTEVANRRKISNDSDSSGEIDLKPNRTR